jgi:hypothetical protein
VFFPFTNYKKFSFNTGSNNVVLYTSTARSMLVWEPLSTHDAGVWWDNGASPVQYLTRTVESVSGSSANGVTFGSMIVPSGAIIRGSGVGGNIIAGTLHVFEMP